ncbi:MAG: hypothetical protein R2772_00860 [Chitinophagales bacterium]
MIQDASEKNKLHELIRSLAKTDKAYLKKYSKIFIAKEATIHKIYYSILEKMEVFSLDELKRKLDQYGGYRRFKNAEQELYTQILEDLVVLKSKKRPTWQYYMEHMKLGYLFLSDKHEEAMKQFDVLEKVRDKANNSTIDYLYHKFHYHHLASVNIARTPEDTEKELRAEEDLRRSLLDLQLEFLIETAAFNFDKYRFGAYNKTRAQFVSDLKSFHEKYVDPLPQSLTTKKWKMRSIYYHFFCNYHMKLNNSEESDRYSRSYYEEFKQRDIKSQFYLAYINALYFRISYLVLSKNQEVYELLEEFRTYLNEEKNLESRAVLYAMYCQCSLHAYTRFVDFKAIENFIESDALLYQKDLKASTIRVVLAADFLWAYALFKLKKYSDAQVFLDKIFKALGKIQESYNNILIAARLLDILIHFELKNYENIDYYINNLEKEIARRKQLIQFDKDFFKHLKRLNKSFFSGQEPDFTNFISFLENNKEEDRVESYVQVVDMKTWLQKMLNVSL